MKRVLGLAVVAVALGVWGGVRAQQSGSGLAVETGLAIVIGFNVVLCLWVWYRARPRSGDAMVMPVLALLSASMLLGILPRLIWPAAESIHVAGSIGSIIVTIVVAVIQVRRRRRLRRSPRPV